MSFTVIIDLQLWYAWHYKQGTLPKEVSGMSLSEVYRHLGVPIWDPARAWKRSTNQIQIEEQQPTQEQVILYKDTLNKTEFYARWSIGPDGDLWQTEYPVKKPEDLYLFETLIRDESLCPDEALLSQAVDMFLNENIGAIELPIRPFSRLLLDMLGFNQGFMILMAKQDKIETIINEAEEQYLLDITKILNQLQKLINSKSTSSLKEHKKPFMAFLPDNIDASFITPSFFKTYMFEGYKNTAKLAKQFGLVLTVHTGGPVASLLTLIKDTGIDCLAGVCGPPQSDATLKQAREKVGPDMMLWGGIPQDCLMPSVSEHKFLSTLEQVKTETDQGCIIGIADHVPVEASWERLKQSIAFFKHS